MLVRLVVNATALAVATWMLDGITLDGSQPQDRALTLLGVALVFGLLNSLVKPVVKFLSLPVIWLTLGLALWVINAAFLLLTSWLAGSLGLPWHVDGLGAALVGSLVVSLVSALVGGVLGGDRR